MPPLELSPDPERLWTELLSADPDRIREAFGVLATEERARVLDHLRRMATEEGWQPLQQKRARAALAAIEGPEGGAP